MNNESFAAVPKTKSERQQPPVATKAAEKLNPVLEIAAMGDVFTDLSYCDNGAGVEDDFVKCA